MELNDAPEHMNELIPYRCPKCGNLRRFATLRELRQHLQSAHSFQMGFVKPHARAHVFQRSRDSNNSLNSNLTPPSWKEEEKYIEKSSKYSMNTAHTPQTVGKKAECDWRENSPLLKTFKDEKEILERELQLARENEMKHKTQSMQDLTKGTVNSERRTALDSIGKTGNLSKSGATDESTNRRTTEHPNFQWRTAATNPHQNSVEKTKSRPFGQLVHNTSVGIRNEHDLSSFTSSFELKTPPVYRTGYAPYELKPTLDSLNSEVMRSRLNQWVTSDALYKSQELLREMGEAAESRCQEQQTLIQTLAQDLQNKEKQVEKSRQQLTELQSQRERLLDETEALVIQTSDQNTRLQDELTAKGEMLDGLNQELHGLKTVLHEQKQATEHDLHVASGKVKQLEWERDRLIAETERILKRADDDSGHLRRSLAQKEEELQNLNAVLEKLRVEHQAMLEKTLTVYRSSEESREALQTAVQTKDGQLQNALRQITEMSGLQKALVEQSRILTDQADSNTSSMHRMLRTKASQLEILTRQLDTLKAEKQQLEDSSASLAEKAHSSLKTTESLRDMVKQRESDLRTTQSELQGLKSFLHSAADKERVARDQLEKFIEDLIARTERAEKELRTLKSQSSATPDSHKDTAEDFSDAHLEDSTERRSLPSKLQLLQVKNTQPDYPRKANPEASRSTTEDARRVPCLRLEKYESTDDKESITSPAYPEVIAPKNLLEIGGQQFEESGGFTTQCVDDDSESSQDSYFKERRSDHESDSREDRLRNADFNRHRNKISNRHNRYKKERQHKKTYYEEKSNYYMKYGRQKTRKSTNRQREETTRNYSSDSDEQNIPVCQDDSETSVSANHNLGREMHKQTKSRRKVSRGLQVGQFLSLQNVVGGEHETSTESDDESDKRSSGYSYHYSDNERVSRRYRKNSNRHTRVQRPLTIGDTSTVKKTHKRPCRSGHRRRRLNRDFDTKYPVSHQSMTNIVQDREELSDGEVLVQKNQRSRRSRSLSPRMLASVRNVQFEDEVETSSSVSIIGILDESFDVKDHVDDGSEKTDGVFKNIMDENGILWDEEDMDTLPDVSDSELDRVSPSGSEAIATKTAATLKASAPMLDHSLSHGPTRQRPTEYSDNDIRTGKHLADIEDMSLSRVVRILNDSDQSQKKTFRYDDESDYVNADLSDTNSHIRSRNGYESCAKTFRNDAKSLHPSFKFRPIKSPDENKSSTSDKDITSGGKEVSRIMSHSPRIDVIGASLTPTPGSSRTESSSRISFHDAAKSNSSSAHRRVDGQHVNAKSETAAMMKNVPHRYGQTTGQEDKGPGQCNNEKLTSHEKRNVGNKNKESVEETVNRISQKYSPKHTANKSDRSLTGDSIGVKIKEITEKYKVRRNEILHGNGVGTMETNFYGSYGSHVKNFQDKTSLSPNSYRSNSPSHSSERIDVLGWMGQPHLRANEAGISDKRYSHAQDDRSLRCPQQKPDTKVTVKTMDISQPNSPSKDSIECPRAIPERVKSEVMVPREIVAPDELLAEAEQQEMIHQDDTSQLLPNQKKKIQLTEAEAPNQIAFVNSYQGKNVTEDSADALETIIAVSPVKSKLNKQNGKLVQDELMTKVLDTQRTPDMLEQVGLNSASSEKVMHEDESLYEGRSSKNESYTAVEKSVDTQPKTRDESNIYVDEAAANSNSSEKDIDNSGELSSFVVNTNGSQRKQKTLPAVPSPVALFEDIETEPSQMSLTNKSNLFAQEIDDDSTVDCDSNTQSYLDLPDHLTDTDLDGDTDTESVRKEFFQEARRIKDLLGQQQHEGSEETVRHKLRRNTASSVSSQG